MNVSQIYILISIIILLIIAIIFIFVKKDKKDKRLTPLAGIAFGFILLGMFFEDNRLIGYSLIGIGVLLAIIDIFIKTRKDKKIKNRKRKWKRN
jgi:hypothetical protein